MDQDVFTGWDDKSYRRSAPGTVTNPALPVLSGVGTDHLSSIVWARHADVSALKWCLTRLVAQLEPTITSTQIKEALPDSDELDELSFANTMANLGYTVKELKLSAAEIDRRLLPCLFIAANGTTCVLLANDTAIPGGGEPLAYNGNTGATGPLAEIAGNPEARGRAFVVRKTGFETKQQRTSTSGGRGETTWFGSVVGRFSGLLWQLLIIGFLLNAVAVASPLFLMFVYDRVIATQNTEHLPMLAAGVSLAILSEYSLRVLRTRILSWLTARIHYIVGTEIFTRLVELPPSVSRQITVTAQLARMRSFESVRDFFSGPIFVSALELPSVIIAITVLVFFSPWLAAVPVVIAVLFTCLFFVLRRFVSRAMKSAASNASIAQKFCVETFQELEDIRTTGLADVWTSKYRDISGRDSTAQAQLHFLGAIGENLSYSLSIIAGIAVLVLGVNLVWAGEITAGMLVASMILIWRAVSPFYALCSLVPRFEQFRHSVAQIHKLQELASEDETRDARARLPNIRGDVSFDNVTIRYSKDAGAVFLGLNADIKAGEIVAVTGAVSSGKSTLLNLVLAISTPQIGKILIDGVNVHQLTARDLRRQIGYVSQTTGAYPGTIAENLLTAKPEATDAELWEALDRAGATGLVRSLPNGLYQSLNSAARRRIHVDLFYRIALARVFLQDPKIVLIDEMPSVVLNTGVQAVLSNFLIESRGKRTVIFVTQRTDHMRLADQIIGLRHGRIPIVGSLEKVLGLRPAATQPAQTAPLRSAGSSARIDDLRT